MSPRLIQIPGIANHHQTVWQVRVLEINSCPADLGGVEQIVTVGLQEDHER